MDFTKEFKVKEKWSLPKHETHFCYGELSFNLKDGIILEIFGSLLQSKNIHESKNNIRLGEIWGVTQDGKCITLLDAFGDEFGSNNLLESRFKIQYAILSSTHFLNETDVFETININLNCNVSHRPSTPKSNSIVI